MEDVGRVQCGADPYVFKLEGAGEKVRAVLVVPVYDILIGGSEVDVQKVGKCLNN